MAWLRQPKKLTLFPCLICGVDSLPIKLFLGVFIGGLFIASVFLLFWAFGSGRLKTTGKEESMALLAEEQGEKK